MSWRDYLGQASFRGVKFWIGSREQGGGRQAVGHTFPFSEDPPYSEDMGIAGRTFSVEGHVLGDEYIAQRDLLLKALEQPGPGELVHPAYGTRRVVAKTYRVRETSGDGGIAQFSIEFAETSAEPSHPVVSTDGASAVTAAVAVAKSASTAQFLATYSSLPVLSGSAVTALNAANNAIGALVDAHAMATQRVAALKAKVAALVSGASALLAAPADLVVDQVAAFEALTDALLAASSGPRADVALLSLYAFNPGTAPPSTTPNRETESANYNALQRLVQRLALVQASAALIALTFDSYDAAVSARSAVCDLIDAHVEAVADDTYQSLADLRSALVGAVPGDGSDLPHLQHYTPIATVPSLVLAHQLYGNVDREADVLARNGISNPGFVAGGVELEVLSDA